MTEKQYPELPDPTAWRSYDNLLKRARYDAVPITSTQPGIYSHTRMFTEDQTRAFADATCAMRAQAAPVAQGDALPREDFARMVVQEACETDPADEDDPECIRILRRDLKSAVLAAFLREDAARAQQEHKP